MLTPAFELNQNDEYLIAFIQIPYAKVSEIDVHFEDSDFIFHSKPYYLRLNLPGKVQYAEKPDVEFNVAKNIVTVKVPKAVKGQVFDGLDLITKLLAPKKKNTAAIPLIEVIDGANTTEDDNEEFDWSIEQIPCEEFGKIRLLGDQCGFANSYSYAVFKLKEETQEIFDIGEPHNKTPKIRREERLKAESEQFDEDHYIADLYHDEEIQQLLKYNPEWEDLYDKLQSNTAVVCDGLVHFTPEEKEKMRKLPSKEYVLDKNQMKLAFLGLIDIIFAYAYNKRTTEGENTVESAWTVNKLSSTLSWLESFSTVDEVALTCIRRSLCYPLYRHFELSVTILEDVRKIFLLGRKYIIKCLLEIHEMFCFSEPRYILNDLFITDYCVWMQSERCASKNLVPLANALEKVLLTKGDIGFNLVDIESFAAVAWMTHNPNAKGFPLSISKESTDKSHSADASSDTLCLNIEKLSFEGKQSNLECGSTSGDSTASLNDFSEYESCSSCTSGSSCSSSNILESDSDDSLSYDDTASTSDNAEESDSTSDSSEDDVRKQLLKKDSEKYR